MADSSMKNGEDQATWQNVLLERFRRLFRQTERQSCRSSVSDVVVCQYQNEKLQYIRLKSKNNQTYITQIGCCDAGESIKVLASLPKRCTIIAVLSKTYYLTRIVEMPQISLKEIPDALNLQIEAILPSEMGTVQISYRPLITRKTGYVRYEVYYARKADLSKYLSLFGPLAENIMLLLPSALAWSGLFSVDKNVRMICTGFPEEQDCEIAFPQEDGSIHIRSVHRSHQGEASLAVQKILVECVRTLRNSEERSSDPIIAAWLGKSHPTLVPDGLLAWKRDCLATTLSDTNETKIDTSNRHLGALAYGITKVLPNEGLQSASLLPEKLTMGRKKRRLYRNLVYGVILSILALGTSQAAIEIRTFQYQKTHEGLLSDISSIQREGDTVGRRINQLEAITSARSTTCDAPNLLQGLYIATPQGVTYNSVELLETGVVRLRGQAESLSLPFLLPEQLEKQPMFHQVVLRDAGQVKKSGGTVTEFRVDCYFKRGEMR